MEIFGIGPLEILLIALVAFIVLGPDRIPGVMRQLGKWTRQLRETANNITRDYNSDIREITSEITALQDEIRSIQRDITGIATGMFTLPPDTPSIGEPPARSNTAAPAGPSGSEKSASKIQSLTDEIKRASAALTPTQPAAQSAPQSTPPTALESAPVTPVEPANEPAGSQSTRNDSFEI
jgi:sec-independent protein translocase protein TatB